MTSDLGDYWSEDLIAGLERDAEEVRADVERGAMSVDDAMWKCGVVFVGTPGQPGFAVDHGATATQRAHLRVAGAAPGGA